MDTSNTKLKVVMLPWLAHGHVSPFLQLSKRLIDRNFFIYFCSTPIILNSLTKKINQKHSHSIKLVELHLTPSPELPPHHHTTKDLPAHLIPMLKDALDMACPSFSLILEAIKPDLVVYDSFQPWATDASSAHNIPAVQLVTSGAAITAFALHMMESPEEQFPFDFTPNYFKKFFIRGGKSPPSPEKETTEREKKGHAGIIKALTRSHEIILVKTFEELEGEYFGFLSEKVGKKVVAVGPLLECPSGDGDRDGSGDEIMVWLDKKVEASTVFVSFGSECFLSKEEIEEIALGLELSNVNFLWALRFPVGDESKADDVLPKGFLERVGEKGMIWQSWAPQMDILAHPNIGGFITHCGWGSVIESMGLGVPIIAVPMHLDQPFNAKLVENVGVGLEVWRDKNNGAMKGDEIAKTIRKVLVDKDGEAVREKAKSFSEIMKLKEEERVDVVVVELTRICKQKK